MAEDFIEAVGDGIYVIDTGFQRPRFDAAYLMVENGRAAFIDTGTNRAAPRLLAALAHVGLTPADVDWVIPTHVHLDHAGGVGLLMESLPNARALVHPRGLRHMVDPRALWQGALAVYGEAEMLHSYGELRPVPAKRAEASSDGQIIHLGGRPLLLIDTPGHARHHHCIWDARSRGWFTGDTFGISYREFDTRSGPWVIPAPTPSQFDPAAQHASIERLMSYRPEAVYVTHYGRVCDVPRLAALLKSEIDEMVAFSLPLRDADERHAQLTAELQAMFLGRLREHGCMLAPERQLQLLAMDVELDAQGLGIWLDQQKQMKP